MTPATITTSLVALWAAYSSHASRGRFPCPVTVLGQGTATHIYSGFGAIRLECISGEVKPGRGFQGAEIALAPRTRAGDVRLRIVD